ncbi:MAG: hypothetical protein K2P65_03480, partial [Lachnospiraceae bacterium]|nr:hypothetical protein [Lachnospiraceae bacterium]
MKKIKGIMIALLFIMVVGCSDIDSEQQDDDSIMIEQQAEGESQSVQSTDLDNNDEQNDREVQDSITYAEYSGYWSYAGKSHEQILAEGGIELSCTITEDNQFSGTLFSQQEITERFAIIEGINGNIEQAELYFDYADDEWGNSGTLHLQFLGDSIYVEILNDKSPENSSDYGISGSVELIREKEDSAENDSAENDSAENDSAENDSAENDSAEN